METLLTPKKSIDVVPGLNHALCKSSIVEARKLEHDCPHTLKVKYRGSQH